MTFEEMERTMQFVVEQQARLTVKLDRLSEGVDALGVKVDRTADSVNALLAIAEIHEGEIREITESVRAVDVRQREADERQRRADERQRQADERGRRTDERLGAFIEAVEKIISARGGDKSEQPPPAG